MAQEFPFSFGKYSVEAEIGHGGFGTVYRAIDTTLDRPVALKIMEPLLMRDSAWVKRFRREAKIMARLDHPNIVPIHEIEERDGRFFIAMKLIAGGNLAEMIQARGRLSWERTLNILNEIADALDYAYESGVVHRDLKPANIMLDRRGAILTDFGFAQIVGDNSHSMSLSGGVVGTPAYIAPEAWEGKVQGQSADVYAMACICYEMLTGEVLFAGDTPPTVMLAHFREPQFAAAFADDVPPNLRSILQQTLARDVSQRFPSATVFLSALR